MKNLKKLMATSLCLFLLPMLAMAQDQMVTNTNSYLGVNFEKTPAKQEGKQVIKNEKSFLFVNIIINGKVPFDKSENNN